MTYLRGTTFSEQAAAADLTLGGVRSWAAPAEEDKGYLSGFVRSAKAVKLLREQGFDRVQNLRGGILAWIDRIDPTQAKY